MIFLINIVCSFNQAYKDSAIQFNVKLVQIEEEMKHEEERLLKCYFIKFGELPPLNNKLEDFKFQWMNPDCSNIGLW